jgi:asparagine synthase (glutamine-hydrolysing)
MLAPDRLRADGYFCAETIGRRWRDHLAGRRDATYALWPVLMFQMWLMDLSQVPTGFIG